MAINALTQWNLRATSTANMVNGGGFNPSNAGMLTDLATDTNTANTSAPIVSSASYTFVAGDVNNYVYVKSGTNWLAGWYLIASVAAGKATLTATIGSVVTTISPQTVVTYNVADGCTSNNTATLTAGTFTIDYSQKDAAVVNGIADFASVGASTTLTSATAAFTPVMVGNIFHQTTTGTGAFGIVGWYEIVSYTNATTVVLDRTPNTGTASVACTGYVGGSLDLTGTLVDSFFEQLIGGNTAWIKSGTYTVGQSISIASVNGTLTNPIEVQGYNTIRGDKPTPFGAAYTAPFINFGALTSTFGTFCNLSYLNCTGTTTAGLSGGTGAIMHDIKVVNTSSVAARIAFSPPTQSTHWNIEAVSQNGNAVGGAGTDFRVVNSYFHDSTNGAFGSGARTNYIGNIVQACRTAGVNAATSTGILFKNNTVYGYATPRGIGASIAAAFGNTYLQRNIISGFATGVNQATAQAYSNRGDNNLFFGNTSNASNYTLDATDRTTMNPSFTDVSELTGSTATISTNTLTQTGAFATVVDNIDYIQVHSGTTATVGVYLITSHTANTVTVNNAIGTSAVADKVWTISKGRNFTPVTNLAVTSIFPGSATTDYGYIGAIQPQSGGGGVASYSYSSMT